MKCPRNNTCFLILTRLRILILLLKEMHCLSSQEVFAKRKFFAEFPRVPLGKLVLLIYFWSLQELRSTSTDMAGLTRNTVGNMREGSSNQTNYTVWQACFCGEV